MRIFKVILITFVVPALICIGGIIYYVDSNPTRAGIFTTVLASLIAFTSLVFANRMIQKYEWERESINKIIVKVFEPMYTDMLDIINTLKGFRTIHPTSINSFWNEITRGISYPIALKYNEELLNKIENFYKKFKGDYYNKIEEAQRTITEHIRKKVKPKEMIKSPDISLGSHYWNYICFLILNGETFAEYSTRKFRNPKYLEEQILIQWEGRDLDIPKDLFKKLSSELDKKIPIQKAREIRDEALNDAEQLIEKLKIQIHKPW